MEQLLLVMLLLAAAAVAGYFYLKRVQRRDTTRSHTAGRANHLRDETNTPSKTDQP